MRELRGSTPGRGILLAVLLGSFFFLTSFFYLLAGFILLALPLTASRAVALNVFLYLRIMPLSAGNIWLMVFIVVGTEVWYACLTHSLPTVLHTEWA